MVEHEPMALFFKERHSIRISNGQLVSVDVAPFQFGNYPTGVWLARIKVPSGCRGKGHGRKALQYLCALLDKYQLVCYVTPSAYPEKDALTQKELVKWYERHGWRKSKSDSLWIRRPTLVLG